MVSIGAGGEGTSVQAITLLPLRGSTAGPVLTFNIGWELVGVWCEEHCCAVLDRALFRACLAADLDGEWTVDEVTWVATSGDVVVGLADPKPDQRDRLTGDARWWRLPASGVVGLRECV